MSASRSFQHPRETQPYYYLFLFLFSSSNGHRHRFNYPAVRNMDMQSHCFDCAIPSKRSALMRGTKFAWSIGWQAATQAREFPPRHAYTLLKKHRSSIPVENMRPPMLHMASVRYGHGLAGSAPGCSLRLGCHTCRDWRISHRG